MQGSCDWGTDDMHGYIVSYTYVSVTEPGSRNLASYKRTTTLEVLDFMIAEAKPYLK